MSIADWIMLGLAAIGAGFLLFLVTGAIAACMLSSEISQRERDGFYVDSRQQTAGRAGSE